MRGYYAQEKRRKKNQIPTLRVIGNTESGVKIVDQATRVAIFSVTDVVLSRGQRAEEENHVVIPYNREPFRTGHSLAPKGDLCRSWSFSTISGWRRIE
jgi:hypothetical protein